MTLFFAAAFAVGALYLLLMVVGGLGDALDLDINLGGGAEVLSGTDGVGEATGIGCNVIAGFLVAFGAIGLAGSLAEWNTAVVLVAAVVFGYIVGRLIARFIRFIYAQQSDPVASSQTLVGQMARVTINSPADKLGEAIVEDGQVVKYAVREVSGAALARGDSVQIVSIDGRILNVKKKHSGAFDDAPKPLSEYFEEDE